jgi:zinc/manganese transport system substrate-binding protein
VAVALVVAGVAACGGGGSGSASGRTVVATTPILGDVVGEIVGDDATVAVVMPAGADPHEFQPSAREAAEMREADLLVTNGGGLEAGLDSTVDGAEDDGVAVFTALDHVDPPPGDADAEHAEDDHAETGAAGGDHAATGAAGDDHDEDGGDDDEGHDHGDVDPHFFTDPARMAVVAEALTEALVTESPELDTPALRERADAYVAELRALDAEVEETLATVPDDRRVLVTTHDVLGYFADRYGFELLGSVLPSVTTEGAPSAAEIDALARTVGETGVPAIFADASAPTSLADTLADEVGDSEVVELHTESLGEAGSGADTYTGMIRTNAERVASALG